MAVDVSRTQDVYKDAGQSVNFTTLLLNQGCHLEYPNPIMIMLTTSMPLPRVMALSLVARQVIKDPMPIMIVPSIADSL